MYKYNQRCGLAKTLGILLLAAASSARPAAAQDWRNGQWNYRFEVFGDAARGSFYNGDSNWGSGASYGGGVAVRPFSGWLHRFGFEARAAGLSDATGDSRSSTRLDASLYAFDVVFHPANYSRVQPYVLGGVGLVNARYSRDCSVCVYNRDPLTGEMTPIPYHWETKDTKAGVSVGFGLKVAVQRRISIRSEMLYVDTTPGPGWNWGCLRLQVGVGLHF
jgi:opacity protein-like surface antigen